MASPLGHSIAVLAIGRFFPKTITSIKFWILGIACSVLPDGDVIGFKLGIPYEHMLGHRGLTHSLLFALLIGIFVTILFYRSTKLLSKQGISLVIFFTLCTASHGLLDAMTTGGLGVAFFAPIDNTRYFFSFRPIAVSPLSISQFFGEWGWRVIKSELVWVGIPYLIIMFLHITIGRTLKRQNAK